MMVVVEFRLGVGFSANRPRFVIPLVRRNRYAACGYYAATETCHPRHAN